MNLPKAFTDRMQILLKEEYDDFIRSYEEPLRQGLRVNTLKGSVEDFLERTSFTLEPIPWVKTGFFYEQEERPGKSVFHEAGAFYMQEPSAMAVATLAEPKPGERVLDLCAAPGGKTSQLATYLKGEGLLISNEIHPKRAQILAQNVERMGIRNCVVLNETPDSLAEHFPEFFDCIVVDAPCSGEGMYRKEEAAITEWSPENVEMCAARQKDILKEAVKMLAPGGRLIYSTCTFAPAENEENVVFLLDEYPELSIMKKDMGDYFSPGCADFVNGREEVKHAFRLWPHKMKGEGHFMCGFIKSGDSSFDLSEADCLEDSPKKKDKKKNKDKKIKDSWSKRSTQKAEKIILEEFVRDCFTKELAERILSGPFEFFGDRLFLLPEEIKLEGLKSTRPGLELGCFEKNRFEPAHALAMSILPSEIKVGKMLSVSEAEGEAYIRGESLPCENKGWTIVCVDGYSCGWGKASGGVLKNHYPKGLRRP